MEDKFTSQLALAKDVFENDETIRIRNAVIESSYSLPKVPQALFHLIQAKLISFDREKLERDNITTDDLRFTFDRSEIEKAIGEYHGTNLRRVLNAIREASLFVSLGRKEDGEIIEKKVLTGLVNYFEFDENGLTVEYTPSQLKLFCLGRFTDYRMNPVFSFTNNYSFQIYDLLMQYKNTGKVNIAGFKVWTRTIKFLDLHWHLRAPKSYLRFSNFKANVLAPVIKDINTHGDIEVKADAIRIKRKVDSVIFKIKQKIPDETTLIEIPTNDETMKWLQNFDPKPKQEKMAWEWYVVRNRSQELVEIYQYCKRREARADKEPIDNFDKYFWSLVDEYKAKHFGEAE